MTGNQYFIIIMFAILAYFVVNIADLYIRNKKEERLSQSMIRISEENERLMKALEEIGKK